jgi:TonB-linked SusC/RagA family outer membrane protein
MPKHMIFQKWKRFQKSISVILLGIALLISAANPVTSQDKTGQVNDALMVQLAATQDKADESLLSIQFANVTLQRALELLAEEINVGFSYNPDVIPNKKVSFSMSNVPPHEVIYKLLEGSNLEPVLPPSKDVIVIREKEPLPAIDEFEETVTGSVVDDQGESLPGVTVLVKNTTTGTSTDFNGTFELTVPSLSDTLVFSSIGYQSKEIPIGGRTEIEVTLEQIVVTGEELVVVGFGTQTRESLTGSVSAKSAEEIENKPITSSSQALQGVQGVYVNQAGAQPGRDSATIRIRGRGTLNDNNPLVLVDGIEYPLDQVNPNNIESISVLKDASAAAIYGSRAANGVVLVTTKSGVGESGFNVQYNHYSGFQQVTALPDVVTDPVRFMELRDQAQRNEGRSTVDYGNALIEEYRQGVNVDPYVYPQNDWQEIMFDPAYMQNHNLRFSGASDDFNYSLSLGFLGQDGVLMGTDTKRYSLALNTGLDITDKFTVKAIFDGNFEDFNEPVGGVSYLMQMTLKAQGFHPTYLEDGRYADTFVRSPGHNIYRHPLVLANEGTNNTQEQQFMALVQGIYELPYNLTYNIKGGITKADHINRLFEPRTFQYQVKTLEPLITRNPTGTRHAEQTDFNDRTLTFQHYLEFEETLSEGQDLKALLGFSAESFKQSQFQAYREGFPGNDLIELNAGSQNASVNGTSSEASLMSYFGRVNYDINRKYLFEANFRYDGSSKFAEGNKWGLFPSFAVGWRLVEEDFFQNVAWLSDLKIRASWGQLGNERVPSYRYLNTVNLGQDYSFGDNVQSGAAVTQASDPNVTWETTTTANLGIESGFFRNKLEVDVDLFHKRTSDILRPVDIPSQVGNLGGPLRNIGTVDNRGIEVGLLHRNNIGDFSYQLSGSITWIKNEVVDLNEQEIIWQGFRGSGSYIIKEGYPIDSSYLLDAIGFFDSQAEIDNHAFQSEDTKPGYIKFRDVNGDGVINQDDRVIGPSLIPDYTYAFNIDLNYKAFQLTANFNGVQNVVSYPFHIGVVPFWFGTAVTKDWVNNSWTPETKDSATLPIMTTYEGAVDTNFRNTNFWLKDSSYLRLKNLQITYSIPNSVTNLLGIQSARVYVNGQNLLTFSPLDDFDPERNLDQSNYYEYPSVKTYTAGIQIDF